MSPDSSRLLAGYKQLANVVILVSLPIAGCSLAVAVAAGLTERKRPFSVLRLTGVSVATAKWRLHTARGALARALEVERR